MRSLTNYGESGFLENVSISIAYEPMLQTLFNFGNQALELLISIFGNGKSLF